MKALLLLSLGLWTVFSERVLAQNTCPPSGCLDKYCHNKLECYRDNLSLSLRNCNCPWALNRRVGYIASWSRSRNCKFCFENINPYLYTDLHYAFAYIDQNAKIVPASADDPAQYAKLNALKRVNPLLRTHISIGGWAFGNPPTNVLFPFVASTQNSRAVFVQSVLDFLRKYNFNGVEINWLYPGYRGGSPADAANLVALMQQFRDALQSQDLDYKLSLAIPALGSYSQYFNLKDLSNYVDTFNLMSYDYRGYWNTDGLIGSHVSFADVDASIYYVLSQGVPPSKLNMGVAAYARGFTLSAPYNKLPSVNQFVGGSLPGACTNEVGVLSYREIRDILEDESEFQVSTFQDRYYKALVVNNTQWFSYDNPSTMRKKLRRAAEMCLGGVNVWSIDMEVGTNLVETALYGDTQCSKRVCTQTLACTTNCTRPVATQYLLMPPFTPLALQQSIMGINTNTFSVQVSGSEGMYGVTQTLLYNNGRGVIQNPVVDPSLLPPRPIAWSIDYNMLYLLETNECGQVWRVDPFNSTTWYLYFVQDDMVACTNPNPLWSKQRQTMTLLPLP